LLINYHIYFISVNHLYIILTTETHGEASAYHTNIAKTILAKLATILGMVPS